ncbi:MAG: FmdB family transcriptional regulator [Proteobacteria bacterium]|nr:MAG: FmdB family transcriptional regulator [Pseudomonadota bacterium]
MPLYEYECTQCGAVEEAIQKFSDAPLTTCSKCSGKLSKLISQSSFHLKGTGWYVTDYSNKKPPAQRSKKTADKPSETGKTSTKAAKSED